MAAPRQFADARAVAAALRPSYPVYCLRPHVLARQAKRFLTQFPGAVLYAVKCNPHPLVVDALYKAGIRHFDTASLPEIAQIAETYPDALSYFMHPVKSRAVIKNAYRVYGVRHFVVDHEAELEKVLEETGGRDVTIMVRINTPPSEGTLYHLSKKFGAAPAQAVALLRRAVAAGCPTGIAFHVGSQCLKPEAYRVALDLCGRILSEAGVEPVAIDVGGGFPARYVEMDSPPLADFFQAIRDGLKANRVGPTVEVLCEPGRALVAAGCSLLVQVQLRKDRQLYINDGIYGSLSETVDAGIRLPARLIRLGDPAPAEATQDFVLNGPTCDSLDVVPGTFELPADVREGDWIEIDQVGAYSNALATHFNGFFPETFVTVQDPSPAFAETTRESAA
ncbi:ornithine decarboxylase [Tistlia consotensis]|uniref:ornithine decarboxylase n=1 Tax=Tistlia consotensis USBA 355 TaxID=560819 RepID=A0A1Y6C5E3_9PROT|nr:type III PLP-dependent enzyme [Tistlia consotensis]SMF44020.1 ornithine decarboxylase [Tistlia consotensis USBA 355]SNR43026.1 ornithine decarboxylase [Tistlia consotensis]